MTATLSAPTPGPRSKLQQDKELGIGVAFEASNAKRVFPQQRFDVWRGAVSAPNPDHAGRRAGKLAKLLEELMDRIAAMAPPATLARVRLIALDQRSRVAAASIYSLPLRGNLVLATRVPQVSVVCLRQALH